MRSWYRWMALGLAALLTAGAAVLWIGGADVRAAPELPPPPPSVGQAQRAAVPSPQASAADREARRFRRYDGNRDQIVSRDEYLKSRRASFDRFDANGDGMLSFEEYAVKQTSRFAAADSDGSGDLAPGEFEATRTQGAKPRPDDCKRG